MCEVKCDPDYLLAYLCDRNSKCTIVQAKKHKGCKIMEGWIKNDEGWMKNDKGWMMNDEGWLFQAVESFADKWTDRHLWL